MNDLLQLREDMKHRYEGVVLGRKSLRELEKAVRSLTVLLEKNTDNMIRPRTTFWAVLSQAVAGAAQEAQVLLKEAVALAAIPLTSRFLFFFCLGMGFDSDVRVLHRVLTMIADVVIMKKMGANVQSLVGKLRKVNMLNVQPAARQPRKLSDIQEEPNVQVSSGTKSRR